MSGNATLGRTVSGIILLGFVVNHLVFLVLGHQESDFETVSADDLCEIVAKNQKLFIVVPRPLRPKIVTGGAIGTATAPETWIADLRAVELLRKRIESGRERVDGVIETRRRTGPRNLYPVSSIGKLEVINGRAPKQLGQLNRGLITRLIPTVFNRRILILTPEAQSAWEWL